MQVNSFIRTEYRAKVDEVLSKALAGTPSGGFTFPLFRKDGERLEVRSISLHLLDPLPSPSISSSIPFAGAAQRHRALR